MIISVKSIYLLCLFLEHAFPNEEQAKASCDHNTVCWNNVFLAFYCCEIPDGQAVKLSVFQCGDLLARTENEDLLLNGCEITLLSMYCSSCYEHFVTPALL